MTDKIKNIITVSMTGVFFLSMFLWAIFKPADEISRTERRPLTQFPELSGETVLSGAFMTGFEKYATDQFPERDFFRGIKVFTASNIIRNKDINKYYQANGFIGKIEYPLNEDSLSNATSLFNKILILSKKPTTNAYFAIVPDKGYYLAEENNVIHLDYDKMFSELQTQMKLMNYIDLSDLLSIEDYYKTDTHWRQECITDVADRIAEAMGAGLDNNYTCNTFREDFLGVYASQSGFNPKGEALNYLTSSSIDGFIVYSDPMNKKQISVYDEEKGLTDDGYEYFLSGSLAYVKIVNPNATTDRRLYIFRDSFGSSLAPLLASGYAETVLIDIRSLPSDRVKNYVNFTNADVLFIYSSMVLNNSATLK